ncbi:hypothetical protein [Paracidovorax sp. MALMAid1276]|uniref:hypothetical protein n=1 Tax=Paracidovorax sp. MALMAid1276 TaxID=3411631 RepID=UPI003B995EFB
MAAQPGADGPRNTPRFAALWEVAGLWLLIVLAGVLLIAFLLLNIRTDEEQNIQRARLSLTLAALQESIEGDLALGLDLPELRAVQPRLEKALSADRRLHAIDVVDRAGLALFSTDRGAVGEPLHPRAGVAADLGARTDRAWTAQIGAEALTGLPLHNAFGEVVGHITTSYPAPNPALQWAHDKTLRDALLSPLLLATCALLVAVVLLGGLAARWALSAHYRHLAQERAGTLARALAQSAAVRQRMDLCLARLDESERQE